MKPTIYIHAGMHKTATTSIQNILYNNRDLLQNIGWYYPSSGLSGFKRSKEVGHRHFFLQQELFHNKEKKNWHKLQLEIKGLDDNIIISHENFFSHRIDPEEIKKLLPEYNIKMIVYIRHPVDYIESCYREWVRRVGQYDKDINTFYKWRKQWLAYENILTKWDNAIGSENVIVRLFDKNYFHKGSIIKDFFNVIGLNTLEIRATKRNNESLNSRTILLYLLKNRSSQEIKYLKDLEEKFSDSQDFRIIDDKLISKILNECDKDILYIKSRLGISKDIESKYINMEYDNLFNNAKFQKNILLLGTVKKSLS